MTRRATPLRLIAILLGCTLLATACGDASGGVDAAAREVGNEADPIDEQPDIGQPDAEPDRETEPVASDETVPVELTASFRGVTADTIRVGVTAIDWDTLAAAGVPFGRTNAGDLWTAAIEEINDRGGVHGRTLEVVVEEYLPIGSTEFDAACNRLTQDEEVFVVIGQALEDHVLCLIELNDTAAVVVAGMADPIVERANAPYATLWASFEHQARSVVELAEDAGVGPGATVGISGSADVAIVEYQTIVAAFRDAGYDVVEGLVGANDDDLSETSQAMALVYERFRDADVDLTVATTGVANEIFNAQSAGYTTDQWLLSVVMDASSLGEAGVDLAYLDGALAVVNTPVSTDAQPTMGDDPAVAACIDDLENRTGRTIPYDLGLDVNDLPAALYACAVADIVEQALLLAGPDLTNESFQAGLESIGDIDLAGYFEASLTADDLGAAGGLRLAEFDSAAGAWNLID
ncbi:MAG: ABC transporter substrate-binding protein [Actinomycetota bacterium]